MKTLAILVVLSAPLGGCAVLAGGVAGAVIEHEVDRDRAAPYGYRWCRDINWNTYLCRR